MEQKNVRQICFETRRDNPTLFIYKPCTVIDIMVFMHAHTLTRLLSKEQASMKSQCVQLSLFLFSPRYQLYFSAEMKYTSLKFGLTFLILLSAHRALSQTISSSPYSVYGIGIMNGRNSSLTRSMGGTGIAVQSETNLNPVNPASYTSIQYPISHVYEVGINLESNRYQTTDRTDSKTSGGLNNLNYWFRFKPWWSASAGLAPFSSVSYDIEAKRNLGAVSDVNYTYTGSGNINQLYLGNAFTPFKNLSVGFHLSYLFGSLTRSESMQPGNTSDILTLENKIVARKLSLDFGVQYEIPLRNEQTLIIGAIADNGLSMNGQLSSSLYDQDADTLSTTTGGSQKFTLPKSAGVGLSWQTKRHIVASDLKFQNWSKAKMSGTSLQDTWRISMGYMYKGNPDAETYIGLTSLRAGFYMQNYHINIKGNTLPSWGASAGISIPVFDGKSSVSFTYLLDELGTTKDNLILQRSQKIMIDLVIRDLWGIRRKFD